MVSPVSRLPLVVAVGFDEYPVVKLFQFMGILVPVHCVPVLGRFRFLEHMFVIMPY